MICCINGIIYIKTHSCVSCGQVWVRETLCVIYSIQLLAVFSHLEHKNYWVDFNQNHVLDTLQFH